MNFVSTDSRGGAINDAAKSVQLKFSAAGQRAGEARVGNFLYQQLALIGWTSVPWLPFLRQKTLVLAGDDDPVIPLVNARIMATLIRDCQLHVFHDGHLFLISCAEESATVVRAFLEIGEEDGHGKA